jgi:hypothetical protein
LWSARGVDGVDPTLDLADCRRAEDIACWADLIWCDQIRGPLQAGLIGDRIAAGMQFGQQRKQELVGMSRFGAFLSVPVALSR